MRRADRLFLLVNALRGRRRAVPARVLADDLGVSLRTVYRDVADLQRSGIPIEGEPGVGYMLRKGADLPPLAFDAEELEALIVGIRFARAFAGGRLGDASMRALLKIEAVVPPEVYARARRIAILAPGGRGERSAAFSASLDRFNLAIAERSLLRVRYVRAGDEETTRVIEPLCVLFWGGSWTLAGWCRLRGDFRQFRLDRIRECAPTGETYAPDPTRGFDALMRRFDVQACEQAQQALGAAMGGEWAT
ncbi:helix-turn-helix transcriptional regulator [Cognatilysobacter bugurensis]|uniref:DNA-binding transcriptional regulator n=1 Tax=Cognatilysobacter bugurensis TaxID=543356 RepID=A0A918SZQ0_9GAMM|nr:YafY family protein [Lysobacter bugurensis]GHA78907.1 DNA-binding transcriptional regulator [Lysobacter bugurensis]